jgi:hypothetical protein
MDAPRRLLPRPKPKSNNHHAGRPRIPDRPRTTLIVSRQHSSSVPIRAIRGPNPIQDWQASQNSFRIRVNLRSSADKSYCIQISDYEPR